MMYSNQRANEEHMISDILENFDFNKCVEVMKFLKWEWSGVDEIDVDIMKKKAEQRLNDCIKLAKESKHFCQYFVNSGGLKASVWKNKYGHLTSLQLEFILTEWENDADY